MASKKNTFTQREVGDSISNAVVRALRPTGLGGEIPEARLRKLRAYSQALLAPVLQHVEQEVLRPEEAVIVFLSAAMFLQLKTVMHTDKVPCGPKVIELFEGKSVDSAQCPEPGKPGKRKNV